MTQFLEGGASGPNGRDGRSVRPSEQDPTSDDSAETPDALGGRGSLMSRYRGAGSPAGTEDESAPPQPRTGETPASPWRESGWTSAPAVPHSTPPAPPAPPGRPGTAPAAPPASSAPPAPPVPPVPPVPSARPARPAAPAAPASSAVPGAPAVTPSGDRSALDRPSAPVPASALPPAVDKPSADKSTTALGGTTTDRTTDSAATRPTDRVTDRTTGRVTDRTADRAADRVTDRAADGSTDSSASRTGGEPADRTGGGPADRTGGGSSDRPVEPGSTAGTSSDTASVVTVTRGVTPGAGTSTAPLLSAERTGEFKQRWRDLQGDFVDDPQQAVRGAGELAREVLQELSDSIADSERVEGWKAGEGSGTEDLRVALRQYRTLVDRLLEL